MKRYTGAFAERHAHLEKDLRRFKDPQERMSWLVDRGSHYPVLEPGERIPEHQVHGCASRIWLVATCTRGTCHFRSDSESAILKSLTGLICELYDGLAPASVTANEPAFLETMGFLRMLTENRRRTVLRFREALKEFARAKSP